MKKKTLLPSLLSALLALSCGVFAQKSKETRVVIGNPNPFMIVTGKDKLWTVEVRSSEILYRDVSEERTFSVPYVNPKDSSGVKIYRSRLKKDEIVLKISNEKCFDSVANMEYEYTAHVAIKRRKMKEPQVFSGCAAYIADKRLNAVWQLEVMNGSRVMPNDFGKELPYVDLHIKERIFSGFGGCNRINGEIDLKDFNKLTFKNVISTKMLCLAGNRESEFMKLLHGADSYHITGNRLILYKDGKPKLGFKKLI